MRHADVDEMHCKTHIRSGLQLTKRSADRRDRRARTRTASVLQCHGRSANDIHTYPMDIRRGVHEGLLPTKVVNEEDECSTGDRCRSRGVEEAEA